MKAGKIIRTAGVRLSIMRRVATIQAALALACGSIAAAANPPAFIDLGTLGGTSAGAMSISRAGQVVGGAAAPDGFDYPFIWDAANGMRDLSGGYSGSASAINSLGQVVGTIVVGQIAIDYAGGEQPYTIYLDITHPFIWDPVNGMSELETPPGAIQNGASGINDSGEVVGMVQVAGDGATGNEWHAVIWDASGHMQDLGTLGGGSSSASAINGAGQVVGFSNVSGSGGFQGVTHSFIWDAVNGMRDLNTLVGDETFRVGGVQALNDGGVVAGTSSSAENDYRLVTWDSLNGLRDLGLLGGFSSANSINNLGDIVGSAPISGADTAFTYAGTLGLQFLSLGAASYAYGINDAGQIVGSFQSAAGENFHAFLLNPAPPALVGLSPNTALEGGVSFTLAVNGIDFRNGAVILWNGSERPTTFIDPSHLSAAISASDVAGGTDIVTVLVTIRNPNGAVSNPGSFTITPSNVGVVQSSAADAGETASSSTAPTAAGNVGVTATVQNSGSAPVTVTVANYSSDPSGTAFSADGGFTDVQITGATSSMTATATFYYPSTIDPTAEAALTLLYFNGSAWVAVRSDGNTDPAKDTTDNLDATVSGGRFTVVFSDTSTPTITDLQGTFFAAAVPERIAFTGFLSPIGGADTTGGSSSNPLRTFKMGSTIPVKFTATYGGTPVSTGVHTLQVIKYSSSTTSGTPIDATPQDAATTGNQFRFANGQWQFNLDTKATGMSVGIWQLLATLSDRSTHSVWIQLK